MSLVGYAGTSLRLELQQFAVELDVSAVFAVELDISAVFTVELDVGEQPDGAVRAGSEYVRLGGVELTVQHAKVLYHRVTPQDLDGNYQRVLQHVAEIMHRN